MKKNGTAGRVVLTHFSFREVNLREKREPRDYYAIIYIIIIVRFFVYVISSKLRLKQIFFHNC